MKNNINRYQAVGIAVILLFACSSPHTPENNSSEKSLGGDRYIIRCDNRCADLEIQILSAGGNITQRYVNLDVLAFELPVIDSSTNEIKQSLSQFPIYKDLNISIPRPFEKLSFNAVNNLIPAQIIDEQPGNMRTNFAIKNQLNGSALAHQDGILGESVIVAVIDSGTANNAEIVPVLSGSVIGGENFVLDENEPSATSTANDNHGTWVASMIAGHGGIIVANDSELAQVVLTHAPGSVIEINETEVEIPLVGTAPAASIYALKTFSANSDGAPSSRIIAAMDRVLSLKNNFLSGVPTDSVSGDGSEDDPFVYDSLNIQVLNMSLGGPSLFPGREIDDLLTDALTAAGIVVVTSAGNEGFAAITGGSPGTGLGSIAVGAASDVTHERILRDLQSGPDTGIQFRPTEHMQMAIFSSRGPTADGRTGVDMVANGFASFVQGSDGGISMVSGTSFSAPTIAGAAALLWQAYPNASATEIKTALIESANPQLLSSTASVFDQGHGYLNVVNALDVLDDDLDFHLPTMPNADANTRVADNLQAIGINVIAANNMQFSREVTLQPGQVQQFFIETSEDTHAFIINIEEFSAALPATEQNVLFGDDMILTMVDAPLSFDETRLREFINSPQEFRVAHTQQGIVRIAVMGDWTNVGDVSAEITISRELETLPAMIADGEISEGELQQFQIDVTDTTTALTLGLFWNSNWHIYPAHDLDLIITDPDGNLIFDAATLSIPESITIDTPTPGSWTLEVDGFLLHDMTDDFQLYAYDQDALPVAVTQQPEPENDL